MNVSQRIENGFPAFMSASASPAELDGARTPHPFDSHPPLAQRLERNGFSLQTVLDSKEALPAVSDSWFSAIEGAASIEAEQWKAFEDLFQKAHQETLAWRFKPEGEAEISHVLKFFPQLRFTSPKGVELTLDYDKVSLSDWEAPVLFSTIRSTILDEAIGGHKLVIDYGPEGEKKQTRKITVGDFKREDTNFLQAFQTYYSRHLTAKKYLEEVQSESASKAEQATQAPSV